MKEGRHQDLLIPFLDTLNGSTASNSSPLGYMRVAPLVSGTSLPWVEDWF